MVLNVLECLINQGLERRLHDASLLARVKYRGCARRRFMQVMKCSTGLTLKQTATSIILLA
jgi:hypothetical protein